MADVLTPQISIADLSQLMKCSMLTETEKRAYSDDIRLINETATLPKSPWESEQNNTIHEPAGSYSA